MLANEIVTTAMAAFFAGETECVLWESKSYPALFASPMPPHLATGDGSWGKQTRAHVLLCPIFHGPPPFEGALVRHTCDKPRCINPRHLLWGDHTANMRDAARRGRFNRALTPEEVKEIRSRPSQRLGRRRLPDDDPTPTYAELAREYGVTSSTIGRIKAGKTWKVS